jgi:hypothetical protein
VGRSKAGENKMTIEPMFSDLINGGPNDQEILSDELGDDAGGSDVPHPLDKLIAQASLGQFLGPGDAGRRHAHNIFVEAQERDAKLIAHYRKIASDAEKKSAGDTRLAKRAGNAEFFKVGGQPLAKGEIESRMLRVLSKIRPFCRGSEEELIEKSIRALDFIAFGELSEPILQRMKEAIEAI